MISKITSGIQSVGLFCGGTDISGGSNTPTLSEQFQDGPSNLEVNFAKGFPSIFSRTMSNGISSVSVVANTLYTKGGGTGTYVFSYYNDQNSNKWKVAKDGGDPSLDITISQWGITVSGTPSVGEGFTVLLELSGTTKIATVTSIERANTGKKFLIGDCNLIGYMGTLQQWRRQLGGIRTFSEEFSNAIGGYPKGIVLDALVLDNGGDPRLRKALSLIENNTNSFLLSENDDIVMYNGVPLADSSKMDNVNWAFCDEFNPDYALGSSFPGSVVCAYYAYSNDFNITGSISRSKTLSSDSRLYVAKGIVSFSSVYRGNGKIEVYVTRNGQTKPFYGVAGSQYSSGYIVRAGSTVTVNITCYRCISASVYIYAIPVHSTIERV